MSTYTFSAGCAILAMALTTPAHAQPAPGWNRELKSVHSLAGSAPGLYDVVVKWTFRVDSTDVALDLGTTLHVQVDGVPLSPIQFSVIVDPGSGACGAICDDPCGTATIDSAPYTLYCNQITCACGPPGSLASQEPLQGDESDEFVALTATFPDVAMTVGDQIVATLAPLPTAEPESDTTDDTLTAIFPGLQQRPGDSDGDDDNDLLDFSRFQLCFGSTAPLPPDCLYADSNDDGSIDGADAGIGLDLSGPVVVCPDSPFDVYFGWSWPLPGQDASDWVVNNYYDLDPNPGSACNPGVDDYFNGHKSYDGHTGIDIFPPNFRAMDGDMPVLAAWEGRVEDFEDGEFDRNIANKKGRPGNFVKLRHANGYQSRYWHLKQSSVSALGIQTGDWIAVGQPIGVVGSSGNSSGCHLHFGVNDCDGNRLDPFLLDMWANPPVYHTPLGYMDLWLKDGFITGDNDMKDPSLDVFNFTFPGINNLGIGLYTGGGQPGETLEVKIWRGDGTLFDSMDETLFVEQCKPFKRRGWNRTIDNVTGVWRVEVYINDQLRALKAFEVTQ